MGFTTEGNTTVFLVRRIASSRLTSERAKDQRASLVFAHRTKLMYLRARYDDMHLSLSYTMYTNYEIEHLELCSNAKNGVSLFRLPLLIACTASRYRQYRTGTFASPRSW